MKILAIRGSNIASLSGSFEVDFERPPLSGAGLFAITGPTGAGKSTLLDVLCLALFGETPRGSEAGSLKVPVTGAPDAGGQSLTAKDARNLLRRGAAEGHAEVEFLGSDGKRYRAVWRVRRSRGLATGNIQNASRSLWRRDGDDERPVADGLDETNEKVPEVLGLSFDQFRKAVLLAQGDFAAFLRAKEKERAELLEKITGGEIYSAISQKAYERGQAVVEARADVDRRLDLVVTMDEAARRETEARVAALEAAIGELEARKERLAEARRRTGEAAGREEEARSAAAKVDEAARVRDGKAGNARAAGEAAKLAVESVKTARRRLDELKPELDEAKGLDARVATIREAARVAEGEASAARTVFQDAAREAARLEEELGASRAAGTAAAEWLEAHAGDGPLSAAWEACARDLERLAGHRRDLEAARVLVEEARRRVEETRASRTAAGEARERAVEEFGRADATLVAAAANAAAIDRVALASELREAIAEAGALRDLERLAREIETALGDREARTVEVRDARVQEERALEDGARARRDVEMARAEVGTLGAERERSLAAESLEERRAALVAGEECPLCGSTDHPWAAPDAAPGGRSVELAAKLKEASASLDEARRREGKASHDADTARQDAARAESGRAKAAGELLGLRAEWSGVAERFPGAGPELAAPPDSPNTPAARRLAAERLEAALARREEVEARQQRAFDLEQGASTARTAQETARKAMDGAAEALHAVERALSDAERREDDTLAARAALEKAAQVYVDRIAGLAGGDTETVRLLAEDPGRLATDWEARVAEYRRQDRLRSRAAEETSRLAPEEASARARLAGAERSVQEREDAARRLSAEAAALVSARSALLGAMPVEDVERDLAGAISAAEGQRLDAEARSARAAAEHEGAKGAHETAIGNAREAADRAASARAERDRALAAAGLPPSAAEAAEALTMAAGELQKERDERESDLGRLRAELLADDGMREERARLRREGERIEREGQVWLTLKALIGEASGGKFRRFAQGLTLEALVRAANGHLDEFARRYRLVQAPGSEVGLLVVDRDMGDEMRSVESLSGGESFLVSLALALGLASLAGRRTSIGSLFIDEGFGSLDADTLDRAVSALDAVRARHDRRIGVISHVQGLAEKIGVQVKVVARGGGRSEVRVVSS